MFKDFCFKSRRFFLFSLSDVEPRDFRRIIPQNYNGVAVCSASTV